MTKSSTKRQNCNFQLPTSNFPLLTLLHPSQQLFYGSIFSLIKTLLSNKYIVGVLLLHSVYYLFPCTKFKSTQASSCLTLPGRKTIFRLLSNKKNVGVAKLLQAAAVLYPLDNKYVVYPNYVMARIGRLIKSL